MFKITIKINKTSKLKFMIPLKDDNPTSSKPIVSYGIIGFCVLIFLAQLGLNENELETSHTLMD